MTRAFSYLEVTVHGNPADPRADDIVGDVMANGQVNASWGLHLIDVNLAMGNLVDIVREQGKAFVAANKKVAVGLCVLPLSRLCHDHLPGAVAFHVDPREMQRAALRLTVQRHR